MRITILLAAVLTMACGAEHKPLVTGLEGKSLPEFTLLLPDNRSTFSTRDIPNDKPFVLYHFSPDCPYCRVQTRSIVDNIQSLQDIRFYMFTNSTVNDLRTYTKEFKLDQYPNIVTGVDTSGFFMQYVNSVSIPYTAIYGQDKKLRQAFLGTIDPEVIRKNALN